MCCACVFVCVCTRAHVCPCPLHPWGTYVVDEVCHVGGAGGQCPGRWGSHAAQRGVAAQRRPSQRGAQGCELGGVAQLANVVGILQTKRMDSSLMDDRVGFPSQAPS